MPLHLSEDVREKVLEVHVSGKLHRQDYEKFVPDTERLIKQYGKIRVLMVMRDFHGWTRAHCGRTSSGTLSISTTSSGLRSSARRNGSNGWWLSANRSRERRYATSIKRSLTKLEPRWRALRVSFACPIVFTGKAHPQDQSDCKRIDHVFQTMEALRSSCS